MGAEGRDYDQLQWFCSKKGECPYTDDERIIPLSGKVKFKWQIKEGPGSFVQLGCLPDTGSIAEGDHIIFKPPVLSGFKKNQKEIRKRTTIELRIIDAIAKPKDEDVVRKIVITTVRKIGSDTYKVYKRSDKYKLPLRPKPIDKDGTCKAENEPWKKKGDLKKPVIKLPKVPDAGKMVVGQWMILEAEDQTDTDVIKMMCVTAPDAECQGMVKEETHEDNLQWTWAATTGSFIKGKKGKIGRYVIYKAPDKIDPKKEFIEVTVRVTVKNAFGAQAYDKVPPRGEIKFKVYRAGVKINQTPLEWLPKENNGVKYTSELVYKEGGKWQPALAHMCRIHFFDLMEVSNEPGVCANAPKPEGPNLTKRQCPDLRIKEEKGHELYKPPAKKMKECNEWESYFFRARTKAPLKKYEITVKSEDYGSFGKIRSFANKLSEKDEDPKASIPHYQSIAITKEEASHPDKKRSKKMEYKDNRVTIPRDIDENHIADNGWRGLGKKAIKDPPSDTIDIENKPLGDGFPGDGLAAYEEYRGFKTGKKKERHTRTDWEHKDLFVHNPGDLPIHLFRTQFGYNVYQIQEKHYFSNTGDNARTINLNSKTAKHGLQKGLRLVAGGTRNGIMGIICATNTCRIDDPANYPKPPNWIFRAEVYRTSIQRFCQHRNQRLRLNYNTKLAQVTAHELGHGLNTYHHGEGNTTAPRVKEGLCSGNMSCIMRYDNICHRREDIGSILCTSNAGTGTNAQDPCHVANNCFDHADKGRGNCKAQHRVSGRSTKYPDRRN